MSVYRTIGPLVFFSLDNSLEDINSAKNWWSQFSDLDYQKKSTPQPLYNSIVEVQARIGVRYPIRVLTRVKCKDT